MTLKADPTYPSRRTYVLKLGHDATSEALYGRLENLVTCQQRQFTSAHELLDLIARDMTSSDAEPSSPI